MLLQYLKAANIKEGWSVKNLEDAAFEHELSGIASKEMPDGVIANYGRLEHFLDMLGYNPMKVPRILSNYQHNTGDADLSGTHVCFTTNIFDQPRIMPNLEFGLILKAKPTEIDGIRQGWTEFISHDDLIDRMHPKNKFPEKSSPRDYIKGVGFYDEKTQEPKLVGDLVYEPDYKLTHGKTKDINSDIEYNTRSAKKPGSIHVKGLIKRIEKNQPTYWLQLYKYTWRKITKEIYEVLNNFIQELSMSSSGQKALRKQELFRYPEDSVIPDCYSQIDWKEDNIVEARLFGRTQKFDAKQIGQEDAHKVIRLSIEGSGRGKSNDLTIDLDDDLQDNPDEDDEIEEGLEKKVSHTLYLSNHDIDQLKTVFSENEYRCYRIDPYERHDGVRRYFQIKYSNVKNIAMPRIYQANNINYPLEKLAQAYQDMKSGLNEALNSSWKYIEISHDYNLPEVSKIKAVRNPAPGSNGSDKFIFFFEDSATGKLTTPRARMLMTRVNKKTGNIEICLVNEGSWDFTGGGLTGTVNAPSNPEYAVEYPVTYMEDPLAAAKRETKEETGYDLNTYIIEKAPFNYVNYKSGEAGEDGFALFVMNAYNGGRLKEDQRWTRYLNYVYITQVEDRGEEGSIGPDGTEYKWVPINSDIPIAPEKKKLLTKILETSHVIKGLGVNKDKLQIVPDVKRENILHRLKKIVSEENGRTPSKLPGGSKETLNNILNIFEFLDTARFSHMGNLKGIRFYNK